MAIAEAQLATWSKQGAVATSSDTYQSIKKVIESVDAPYGTKRIKSFLQGSYGNDTNVYGVESDVDIVLRCDASFYYDLDLLPEQQKQAFHLAHPNNATYRYENFREDVTRWLLTNFGSQVDPGEKAIRISGSNNRREADVLPCVPYRRYLKFNDLTDQQYVEGVCFFTRGGTQIINYPQLHSANMTTRHQATGDWLKPIVRISKNLRNAMVRDGYIEKGFAPSYYLEGLFYNVPNSCFGVDYASSFTQSINWLLQAERSQFLCANEQYYLLNESSPVTWRAQKCSVFLSALVAYWKAW